MLDDPDADVALHIPSLWHWIRQRTQSPMMRRSAELTVMRAATEALAPHGITTVHELKSVTWCYDPTVIEAIEDAVHNTFEDRLPPACYRTLS